MVRPVGSFASSRPVGAAEGKRDLRARAVRWRGLEFPRLQVAQPRGGDHAATSEGYGTSGAPMVMGGPGGIQPAPADGRPYWDAYIQALLRHGPDHPETKLWREAYGVALTWFMGTDEYRQRITESLMGKGVGTGEQADALRFLIWSRLKHLGLVEEPFEGFFLPLRPK